MKKVITFTDKDLYKFKEHYYLNNKKFLTVKNPNLASSKWDTIQIGGTRYEVVDVVHVLDECLQKVYLREVN